MRLFLALGPALTAALAISCSHHEDREHRETSRGNVATVTQGIQGGSADSTHKYSVGVCIGGRGNGTTCQGGGVCSGTLIAPNVILTARHCVDQATDPILCANNPRFGGRLANTFDVTTHNTMFGGGIPLASWHRVASILVPADNHICGQDIALLVLNDLIAPAEAAPIIPGVQYPMWSSRYLAQFTGIGYGATGPNQGNAGTRRRREAMPILCIPGSKKRPCPDNAGVNPNDFVAGEGVCGGDSGSGSYEQASYVAGNPVTFGVLSRGPEDSCEQSIWTRTDVFRDFIVNGVRTASNNWALYPEPSWTAPVIPEEEEGGDAGPPPVVKKDLGESCVNGSDCLSGQCVDPGDGTLVCTKACDDANNLCPEGFTCQDALCFVPPPDGTPPRGKTTTTTSSCAVTGENQEASWGWGAALGIALGLSAVRRRKR